MNTVTSNFHHCMQSHQHTKIQYYIVLLRGKVSNQMCRTILSMSTQKYVPLGSMGFTFKWISLQPYFQKKKKIESVKSAYPFLSIHVNILYIQMHPENRQRMITECFVVPSSTALVRTCRLKSVAPLRQSVHLVFGLPLLLLPSTFSRKSCFHMTYSKQLQHALPPKIVLAWFYLRPTHSSFWASTNFSSSTTFQMNHFFSSQFS